MVLNGELIKKILTKLNEVYPKDIEKMKDVIPDYEDQEKIYLHLSHCQNMGWVEFKDASSRDFKACMSIKITTNGIKYLKLIS